MVSAERNLRLVEARAGRQRFDGFAKVLRRQPRVAALLIDLIAGRLDETLLTQMFEACLNHGGMSRADGDDALSMRAPSPWNVLQPGRAHRGRAPARNASSSAKEEAPSIGPFTVTILAPAALA
jgi:hypothetical protein